MADHVTNFKHPKYPQLGFITIVAVEAVKEKKDIDCPGKLLDVQPGHHFQGYEHKERLEHSTQRQIFKTHYKWYDYKHAHTTYTKQLTNNTKQTDKTKRSRKNKQTRTKRKQNKIKRQEQKPAPPPPPPHHTGKKQNKTNKKKSNKGFTM